MKKRIRLFEVSVDTNPGGWKSGNDHTELVLAETPEEALELVEKGWSYKYEFNGKNGTVYTYGIGKDMNKPYYKKNRGYRLSVTEIKFKGVDLILTTERKEKLNNILK